MKILRIVVGGLAGLLMLTAILTVAFQEDPPDPRPAQQQAVCAAIDVARPSYSDALDERNQIRRNERTTAVRQARRQEFARLLPENGRVEEWSVIVGRVSDEALGGLVSSQLRLGLRCDAVLVTVNDLSEIRSELGRLEIGESILVSGSFEVGDKDDFVREMSLTEFGGIDEPEFAFHLERLLRP